MHHADMLYPRAVPQKIEDVNMVTEYILSDMERHILRRYLEDNITLEGFTLLIHPLKRGFKRIKKDQLLIEAVLNKIQ